MKPVAGAGTDEVISSVIYMVGAGVRPRLCGPERRRQSTAINLTGNEINNFVTGNAGANLINGGAGNDTLTGNAGNDFFFFNTALNAATNVDTIIDFSVAEDTIRLENAFFTGLATGTLEAGAFRIGAAAADADDRIIYNSAPAPCRSTATARPPAARPSSPRSRPGSRSPARISWSSETVGRAIEPPVP